MPIEWDLVDRHQSVLLPQYFIEQIEEATLQEAALDLLTLRNEGGMMVMRNFDPRDKPGNIDAARSVLADRYDHRSAPTPSYDIAAVEVVEIESGNYRRVHDVHQLIAATRTTMSVAAAEAFINLMQFTPRHPLVGRHIAPGIDLNGSDSYIAVNGPALAIPVADPPKPPRRRGGGKAAMPPAGWRDEPDLDGTRPLRTTVYNPYGVTISDFIHAAQTHADLATDELLVSATAITDITPAAASSKDRSEHGLRTAYAVMVNEHPIGYYDTVEAAHEAAVATVRQPPADLTYLTDRFHNPFDTAYEVKPVLLDGDGREARLTSSLRIIEATATVHVRTEVLEADTDRPVTGWVVAWQTPDWHRNRALQDYLLDADGTVLYQLPYNTRYRR
jgi:hypothetical protein